MWTEEPKIEDAFECRNWNEKRASQRAKDAERVGVPLVITEFNAWLTEEPSTQEINQVGATADDHLVGWAYWKFKTYADLTTSAGTGSEGFWNQEGTLQDYKVKALARSYMPYTQSNLFHMKFDTETAFLDASFTFSDASKDSETSVYLNKEYWYPSGYDVYVKKKTTSQLKKMSSKKKGDNYFNFNVVDQVAASDGDTIEINVYSNSKSSSRVPGVAKMNKIP